MRVGELLRAAPEEWLDESALDADAVVVEGTSEWMLLPDESVDLVLTDPPYHDDVQYDELSLPLRAWAGLESAELEREAVVNDVSTTDAYEELLRRIFSEARRILKPDGHLLFSYANRVPEAWVAVLRALAGASFRACGYEIVHSENETDYAKRGVRACTFDLLLDLVPAGQAPVEQHRPSGIAGSEEELFLRLVGDTFLQLDQLEPAWEKAFAASLRETAFLGVASVASAVL